MKNTKKLYGQPAIVVYNIAPQQMICDSKDRTMTISDDDVLIDPSKATSRRLQWDYYDEEEEE